MGLRTLVTSVALVGLLTGPASALVILQDDTFADADWSAFELIDTSTNDSFVFTGEQSATDGNPGAYRRVVQSVNQSGPATITITSAHLFLGGSYDPATQGAVATLQFDFDGIGIPGGPAGAMGYGALVEQGGRSSPRASARR